VPDHFLTHALIEAALALRAERQFDLRIGLFRAAGRSGLAGLAHVQPAYPFRRLGPAPNLVGVGSTSRGLTVHAGEAAGPENVRFAVEELAATRLGHGVRTISSPEVLALLREREILLEVCPTSNIHTQAIDRIENHPVRHLYRQEIALSIGDDDPITSRTRVSNELTLLQRQFGFSRPELGHLQTMSIDAAFLADGALQRRLRQEIVTGWAG
jgi:adenosine deaminase